MATRSSLLWERQGWRDSSRGFSTAFWALMSLSGKESTDVRHPDRATPQPQHTHATTGTPSRCHYSPHNARAWRLACTCVPSVIDACVAASKAVAAASVLQEDFSPCVLVRGHLDATCVTDQSRAVLLCEQRAFPPALSSAQLLPFPLPSPSVFPSSPSPTLSPSVFFSFSWLTGSEPGFVQQLALSEEHSNTKRGSRQEHLSANSRVKHSPNSLESCTDRHFLASEVGETLASNLQRVIDPPRQT